MGSAGTGYADCQCGMLGTQLMPARCGASAHYVNCLTTKSPSETGQMGNLKEGPWAWCNRTSFDRARRKSSFSMQLELSGDFVTFSAKTWKQLMLSTGLLGEPSITLANCRKLSSLLTSHLVTQSAVTGTAIPMHLMHPAAEPPLSDPIRPMVM